MRFCLIVLLSSAGLLLPPPPASAHPGSMAFWKVTLSEGEARSQILVAIDDLPPARIDAPDPGDGSDAHGWSRRVRDLVDHFAVVDGGAPTPATLLGVRRLDPGMVELRIVHRLTPTAGPLALRSTFDRVTDAGHRVMARVDVAGVSQAQLLTPESREYLLPAGAATAPTTREAGATGPLFVAGLGHIVTGYDHVLFLLCLLVPGGTWRSRVAIVTAFTAAHSLTLALAALQVVVLPPRFVEAAIALSLAYVALENLVVDTPRRRWPIAFGFGLVHGVGLAGALHLLGLPAGELARALLAFNGGVEVGQLAIVAIAVPAIGWLTRQAWHPRLVQATSVVVCALAGYWVVERLS